MNLKRTKTGTGAKTWRTIRFALSFLASSASAQGFLSGVEDFEGTYDGWAYYDGANVWSVATPTKSGGPPPNDSGFPTHSGSKCLVTTPSDFYPAHADSRFASPEFVVPSASNHPRLRFWQWFALSGSCGGDEGSYGIVEVKVGADWHVIGTTNRQSSGGWTECAIDLTLFAGLTVQVAFHFHSAGCIGYGWYVDDVALVTGESALNNPEGWESGLGDWYSETGVWQVGTPTKSSGPWANGYQTHSGSNCAATVLTDYYPPYADSRLASPAFVVPAADSYPRLRFWQWFSLSGSCGGDEGSFGSVEIKAGEDDWQAVGPTNRNSSGGWTESSLDLKPYAGQRVQVAFHFHSAACIGTGWYLDDVSLVTGEPVLKNPESWESGLGDWYSESGIWQVGSPAKSSGPPANASGFQTHTGSNCAATVLTDFYPSFADSRFISPEFIAPAANIHPRLRFWHWFSLSGSCGGDEGSYGYVEVKAGANDWQTVSPTYNNGSGAWIEDSIDLAPYGGQTVQLAFHFHSAGCLGTGWLVDDITVETDPLIRIATVAGALTLSWPTNGADGFQLQTTTNLIPPILWVRGDTPTIVGQNYQLTLSPTNDQRFFRLQK